ncbi:MAG: AMP-binding protein [Gemmatimonadaceae bacterium]|nr:AMP-binding protein [Acetobacteraceae bacterium]
MPDTFRAARDLLLLHRRDLAAARAAFRWPVLDRFNWAIDHFDRMAAGNDAPALRFVTLGAPETGISFADLSARSNQVANHLRALGIRRGDRILLLLGNVQPLWEAMLAAMKLGAVVIPATTMLTEDDLRDRFTRGRVQHVIAAGDLAPRFAPIEGDYTRIAVGGAEGWTAFEDAYAADPAFVPDGDTRATDPLLLYFTSGTTSKPKLVLHSHQSYPVGHLSTMFWIGLQPGDVHLNISSPGWAKHAWSSFFAPWNAGATILILNQPRFDARHLLAVLAEARVTTFCAPPTVWRMLVQEDLAAYPVRLQEAVAAGEPLNPEVIDRVQAAWGVLIRDGYGQTETTLQVANTPGQAVTPGSMGHPLPGYDVVLADPDGQEAEEGEIALRLDPAPLGLMQGYLQEDGTLRPVEGALYRTGDVAMRNPDGSLTYVGRADDVFKSSGYRISPFELESVLIEHPAVAEAAVVPSPDPTRTALPKAFVLLADGHAPDAATAASIFVHLRARLAPYKRIKRLEFADLPKTISGKIRRVELRRLEAARRGRDERGAAEFYEEDAGLV